MKAIVGLGNPGPQYRGTRHNVGFEALAELAARHQASSPKVKFESEVAETSIAAEKALLLAPQTYMNLSGRSVRRLVDFYQLPLDDLLIVCDDMNLEPGRIRLRSSGSAGGQKGLQDVIDRLATQDVPRLRIGIGQPPGRMSGINYVLGKLSPDERELIEPAIRRAADGIEIWVRDGIAAAMNSINAPASDG